HKHESGRRSESLSWQLVRGGRTFADRLNTTGLMDIKAGRTAALHVSGMTRACCCLPRASARVRSPPCRAARCLLVFFAGPAPSGTLRNQDGAFLRRWPAWSLDRTARYCGWAFGTTNRKSTSEKSSASADLPCLRRCSGFDAPPAQRAEG